MKEIFNRISSYREEEVTIIDYFGCEKYQNPLLFSDVEHLNLEGARLFTEDINCLIELEK